MMAGKQSRVKSTTESTVRDKKYLFEGIVFYLDLRNVPSLRPKLTFGINALHGTTEEFLSQEVKYVITDKPEKDWPKRHTDPSSRPSTTFGGCQATSTETSLDANGQEVTTTIYKTGNPFVNVTYAAVTAAAPGNGITTTAGGAPLTNLSSSTTTGNKVEIMSRAKMILDKARDVPSSSSVAPASVLGAPPPVLSQTTDVLDLAVRRGIKLMSCSRMMDFLLENVAMPGIQDPRLLLVAGSLSGEKTESKMKSVKAVPFSGPYIKMESVDQKYRPTFKVFRCWPELVMEPGTGCPFRVTNLTLEVQEKIKEVKAARKAVELMEQQTKHLTESRESGIHTPRNYRQDGSLIHTGGTTGSYSLRTRGSLSKITPDATTVGRRDSLTAVTGTTSGKASSITTTPKFIGRKEELERQVLQQQQQLLPGQNHANKTLLAKKKTPSFCEICCVEYTNIQEHIRSQKHECFARDQENYRELTSVIRSLSSLKDLEAVGEEEDFSRSAKEKLQLTCSSPSTVSITSSNKRAMMMGSFIQIQDLMKKDAETTGEEEESESQMQVSEEIMESRLIKKPRPD